MPVYFTQICHWLLLFFSFFLKIYLFYTHTHTHSMQARVGGGAEGEGESPADSPLSMEPNVGSIPRPMRP